MTQEEKLLLLQDLSSRLPYGVKVHCEWNMFRGDRCSEDGELVSINIYANSIHFKRNSGRITEIPLNRIDGTVLPYLRSLSSMTEEENEEWEKTFDSVYDYAPGENEDDDNIVGWHSEPGIESYDWLNAHHFDFRNLIEKKLALEATEGMYNLEKK